MAQPEPAEPAASRSSASSSPWSWFPLARLRRSTVLLTLAFVAVFVLYLLVRPG